MKIKLTPKTLQTLVIGDCPSYDKYVSPLINMASFYSQATRPRHVGQLTELIRECNPENCDEWRACYLDRNPGSIDSAVAMVIAKLELIKEALRGIDELTVRRWIEELIFDKTFVGLRLERALLQAAADELGKEYRESSSDEESRGIDGYLDGQPVSVKPSTYSSTTHTQVETIDPRMIYYKKRPNGSIVADLDEVERP